MRPHRACSPGDRSAVDVAVPGWKIVYQQERFTLYAPTDGQDGTTGIVTAMTDLASALGVLLGGLETYAAAAVLDHDGKSPRQALIAAMFSHASPQLGAPSGTQDPKLDPFIIASGQLRGLSKQRDPTRVTHIRLFAFGDLWLL